MYDVLVFENQDFYAVHRKQTMAMVLELCKQYIPSGNAWVDADETYAVVGDRSGCHKPMMLIVIGQVSEDDARVLKSLSQKTDRL